MAKAPFNVSLDGNLLTLQGFAPLLSSNIQVKLYTGDIFSHDYMNAFTGNIAHLVPVFIYSVIMLYLSTAA